MQSHKSLANNAAVAATRETQHNGHTIKSCSVNTSHDVSKSTKLRHPTSTFTLVDQHYHACRPTTLKEAIFFVYKCVKFVLPEGKIKYIVLHKHDRDTHYTNEIEYMGTKHSKSHKELIVLFQKVIF